MTIHPFELADGSALTHIVDSSFTCSFTGSTLKIRRRFVSALFALVPFLASCSDGSGPPGVGPLDRLAVQSGGTQTALAGTALPNPIIVVPQDDQGRTVVGQTATFTVVSGGGSLSSSTGQTNADGTITGPTWTLGKSAVPQEVRVDVDGKTMIVTATVRTEYSIEVRFYGAPLSSTNQALFTSAAARIRAFIVGKLPLVNVEGANVSPCTGTTIAPLTGTIDGVAIYSSVDSIDGPGKTLAQAGPCYIRQANGEPDFRTVIGVMKFDSADMVTFASSLQQTITHEMLHVLGLGSFWDSTAKNLIINSGMPGAAYTGPAGVAGCQAVGGTFTCSSSVPIEDCVGLSPTLECGDGTRELHWKETTFRTELMTGYLNTGTNPISVMTIRSFEDLNYTVNTAAADAYTIAIGSFGTTGNSLSLSTPSRQWERPLAVAPRMLPTVGPNASIGAK